MQTQSSFEKHDGGGALFLVPTPIGNLSDMTFRAVETLKTVDLIAAEDTRNTQKLLNHFEIETRQISFHEHNTSERIPELITKLQDGMNIAQVSDAGMPSISDPGKELVKAAVEQSIPVVPLPGANAGVTALIASGINPQPFYFYGFLPRKDKDQRQELVQLAQRTETTIYYEAPHRLTKTLKNIVAEFGEERQAVLGRELTKKHEEFIRGSLSELLAWATKENVRGEFVIIIAGNDNPTVEDQPELTLTPIEQVQHYIAEGMATNAAIKLTAKERDLRRQDLYNQFHDIK
ncbi:S-adenosylmethionine-dependent methyltransferase, YraL family [Lentilactobacillus senioris DSM 24302 = JCM 17472]|uniref:Ribosomal RNA small subunit methyltransferase I n=1 Tax=Lentilactobacillus senioris DSM 24302 = JCM 17472 TaxID=1423802 RepID=A0A0R2CZ73_9LACO|nr:16S rRNA (cytidine(1402)-2'-O)-methyltransferase [Lentilactobacillus senioris]KRM93435.1 S-adenosylmethionine-dependent methyltransferase, YraL family [Lentilactobacillus senioris DSM 24302 = JCM 17472]